MKRIIATTLALALFMLLGLSTACGLKEKPEQPTQDLVSQTTQDSIAFSTEPTSAESTTESATEATTELVTEPATVPSSNDEAPAIAPLASEYYIGEAVKTKKGYAEEEQIGLKDLHNGWTLGQFLVTGHTSIAKDADGNPVFLKTLGDEVALSFRLEQDINMLGGDEKLSIAEDKAGYDTYFGIEKSEVGFGRGILIMKSTNYQNMTSVTPPYLDYLSAKETDANTEVELFEEGDYEVALNYRVKNTKWLVPIYTYYKISFKFSVRNGNCMVFPFDAVTKSELAYGSATPNGFTFDLANSRYLDVNIKREVLADGASRLVEDTRFNGPMKDGYAYTEEGIYTITVSNRYTGQQTVKKICVGTNRELLAHMR